LCFKVYSGELKNISRKGPPENRAMKVVEVGNQGIPRCAFFGGDLGGGNFKYLLFSPRILGEVMQFDEHIFEMGWFNHQLGDDLMAWPMACITRMTLSKK